MLAAVLAQRHPAPAEKPPPIAADSGGCLPGFDALLEERTWSVRIEDLMVTDLGTWLNGTFVISNGGRVTWMRRGLERVFDLLPEDLETFRDTNRFDCIAKSSGEAVRVFRIEYAGAPVDGKRVLDDSSMGISLGRILDNGTYWAAFTLFFDKGKVQLDLTVSGSRFEKWTKRAPLRLAMDGTRLHVYSRGRKLAQHDLEIRDALDVIDLLAGGTMAVPTADDTIAVGTLRLGERTIQVRLSAADIGDQLRPLEPALDSAWFKLDRKR